MLRNPRLKPKPFFSLTLTSNYVNVKTKLKKDPFFDSVDVLTHSKDLRILLALKILISRHPNSSVPVSAVSKRSREFEIEGRVAAFLRRYPSVFREFTGPHHNLPWFSLTPEAIQLDQLELQVYRDQKAEIVQRLRRLVLMASEKVLPFRIVQGMLWYLGLPEDFLRNPDEEIEKGRNFEVVEIGDGEKGLRAVVDLNERVRSAIERGGMDGFSLFPSKGMRLKRKVLDWMERFRSFPYVPPYEDCSGLERGGDVFEKRVVGVLHELLSLFVDCSAEQRRILCLRKHLGLPQKFDKCFERHPHVFYLLLKNKTCYVVLKEAYCGGLSSGIKKHPMLDVRKKYVELMNKSEAILRSRRSGKHLKEDGEGCSNEGLGYEKEEDVNEYEEEVVGERIQDC